MAKVQTMRRSLFLLAVCLICSVAALNGQQPTVNTVNGASYKLPPLPGSDIAQGSLFVLQGESWTTVVWNTLNACKHAQRHCGRRERESGERNRLGLRNAD